MDRDGLGEDYGKFGITQEQEKDWRQEYISQWSAQLSVDDMTALNNLSNANAVEALPEICRLADKGDGYSKLWYANAIWDLVKGSVQSLSDEEKTEAKGFSVRLWKELVQGPVSLTEGHWKVCDSAKEHLKALKAEEYVSNYARMKLKEALG